MSRKSDLDLIRANAEIMEIDFSDTIKTCTEFNMLIDSLCKDGEVSDDTYSNTYLSVDSKKKRAYICCGSYTIRIM